MKTKKTFAEETAGQSLSEIVRRKLAFQEENRQQMRDGLLSPEEACLISRKAAKNATFRFKS